MKWSCPICGGRAYQRYGGVYVPAIRFDSSGNQVEETVRKINQHFMCKGCSVHFSNPKLFNGEKND